MPVIIVRYNDDAYDGPEHLTTTQRRSRLADTLNEMLTCPVDRFDPLRVNVLYMFYHSKGWKHIEAAKQSRHSINVIV
jgi:hypothetical protein